MPDDDDAGELTALLLHDSEVCGAVLADYHRHPRHRAVCENFTREARGENPVCGDLVRLTFSFEANGKIACAGFTGAGCAASQASASLLCERLQGLSAEQAGQVIAAGLDLLEGRDFDAAVLSKCLVLRLFSGHPARKRCASLAWEAAFRAMCETG